MLGTKPRRPRLSLDSLRGFCVAARHLSFTRAAQELFVTQPAISREIRTLEEQIGRPLFRRVHRALQLTPAGEELYRAADETLAQLDDVTDRISGSGKSLTVTTTTALASLWLAPRLHRFNRLQPEIDVGVVGSNDRPDLQRDQLDVAIQFVVTGGDRPNAEELMTCKGFPVCAPAVARDPRRPIRTPADLALHVRLDYVTVRDARWLSEWDFWFRAMNIRPVEPMSTLRFPQYDQTIPAAIEGAGVAIGFLPHLTQHLHDGILHAPFATSGIAERGSYFIIVRRDVAERDVVQAFVAWLRSEVQRDREMAHAPARRRKGSPSASRSVNGPNARKSATLRP